VNYQAWQFWFGVAQFFLTVVMGVYVWISNRDKATSAEIKKTAAEIVAVKGEIQNEIKALEKARVSSCSLHLNRTTALEVQVKNSPTKDDMGVLHEKINEVGKALAENTGILKTQAPQIRLLVEHHMNGGKS